MKVYEITVRVTSAYEDIEEVLGDDSVAEDLHKSIVNRSDEMLGVGRATDFSVEFGAGGHIKKVYDSEDKKASK